MALRIRLSKFGRAHYPIYRIVVAESSSPREGKYVDILGTYDPKKKIFLDIKPEKVKEWMQKGAEITDRAKSVLKNANIL